MRLLVQHRTAYRYPRPAALGPQLIRLRPAGHCKAKIETYSLRIAQPCELRWQQEADGNRVARATFAKGERFEALEITVEMTVEIHPVNPFDFFVDERAETSPFRYAPESLRELQPYLESEAENAGRGHALRAFLDELPREGRTVPLLVELNRRVSKRVHYVIRDDLGIFAPERTLAEGRGSCRDSAALLIAVLRARGFAARFVSGYLVQLTDEGMVPNEPRGVGRDVVDLHAWTEVFLPGAGWIGFDSTSGLLCGEGHIPLAATASGELAAPLEGTSSEAASQVSFKTTIARLGHEPRPTRPYEEKVWQGLLAAGDMADERLEQLGVQLTMGGEPTFTSREHPEEPEWNSEAIGPTKRSQALRLAAELRRRLAPGAAILERPGKQYPGESLPRWALEVVARADEQPVWRADPLPGPGRVGIEEASRVASAIARRLGISEAQPAFEDPWRFLQDEANLPVDVDPLQSNLDDSEDRRRLARVLGRGLGREVGFVLPLARRERAWTSERWEFRRGHLFLVPGDSPIGLRLPLRSLPDAAQPESARPEDLAGFPPDPRRALGDKGQPRRTTAPLPPRRQAIRTALCVEPREGTVRVFLPPLDTAQDFLDLLSAVEEAAAAEGVPVALEGYPPPPSPELSRFSVAPDPGVLEVNLPITHRVRDHAELINAVFDAALHAGLHAERYQLDGRVAGSGGGHHLTLGGPSPLQSPFLKRPDLLASLLTFLQHHPSLSYLFIGLFVGPTSQAPRVDEARHESLAELELALHRAFSEPPGSAPPWLSDLLFRHLLVDLTGNTHRAEVCIDKLFDPATSHGRQGLIELRAFEMPPHPRMAAAQMLLMRSLIAALAAQQYRAPLVRWGQALHDRFLLPHWLWQDFESVLAHVSSRGVSLDPAGYRPFLELRCPLAGTMRCGEVAIEVRNGLEPWHVLGEELTAFGTSRYVDSSLERIEIKATGLVPERHAVLVNGRALPLRSTGNAGEAVAGVRFRAWAPPHSLQPHIGIHHPLRIDLLDTWARRSLGACSYHVWHPQGRAFTAPPLTRFEAAARRAQRFTFDGPSPYPLDPLPLGAHPDAPYSTDLRLFPMDRPMQQPEEEERL
ncbi:MAG TPA: transglutaminase family protein [Myxococcaceae bacterium]|nr:transglutaminase family protein [Myxococcaceae bacterium]